MSAHDDDGEPTEERDGIGAADACECSHLEDEHAWDAGRDGACTVCTCRRFEWNGEVS